MSRASTATTSHNTPATLSPSPQSRTIRELAVAVRRGEMSADAAAVRAMDRREAGLCDECPAKLPPGHDHERGGLCAKCREESFLARHGIQLGARK